MAASDLPFRCGRWTKLPAIAPDAHPSSTDGLRWEAQPADFVQLDGIGCGGTTFANSIVANRWLHAKTAFLLPDASCASENFWVDPWLGALQVTSARQPGSLHLSDSPATEISVRQHFRLLGKLCRIGKNS
ncbi:hypothetical protein C2E31_04265 [Rhodopirellula baltica]|nr:hypothetical protein C2E31_04265 [Rhodopirellula baltica]